MPVDWAPVKAEFPALAGRTFLNTATFGQLATRSRRAMDEHFERRDRLACSDFLDWFDDVDRIRESLGRLIGAQREDIAFVPNSASALSLFLGGIDWRAGDRIITLEEEFPNQIYYAAWLASRGVELIQAPGPRLMDAIDERTRAVVVSLVNFTTGYRLPLEPLASDLRSRGVLLYVDGTQGLGALTFDFGRIRPAMLAVHGYKWLNAPTGAAFLCVGPDLRDRLVPTVVGWRSHHDWRNVEDLHRGSPEFTDSAEKYEGGMLAFPLLYALGASVDMFLELGPQHVEDRVLALAAQTADVLEAAGARVLYRDSPIVAAEWPGRDVSELAAKLKKRNVIVSARHGALRVSPHLYNDESDIQQFQSALEQSQSD